MATDTTAAANTQEEWLERGKRVFMNTYANFPIVIDHGRGAELVDANGKKYLDFVSGIAVNSLGHCDPQYVAALTEQLSHFSHCSNLYMNMPAIKLAEKLVAVGDFDRAFFCNSGTEAIEASIKLSRKYAKKAKGEHCTQIVTMSNSFHGRTYGALSATSQEKYHKGYHPLVPDFVTAKFNNFDSIAQLDPKNIAGIIIEPIQGEGGIHVVDAKFLKQVRDYCTAHDIVLIYDEIQCGIGRTGKFFAYQNFDAAPPDVVALAKGLGGGFPIGALLANNKVAAAFEPGDHGSTFGGNALACTAACECVTRISEPEFLKNVHARSDQLRAGLQTLKAKNRSILAIRGLGLMVGVELAIPNKAVVGECINNGMLLVGAGEKVLRMLPPLNVKADEIDQAVKILGEVLSQFH